MVKVGGRKLQVHEIILCMHLCIWRLALRRYQWHCSLQVVMIVSRKKSIKPQTRERAPQTHHPPSRKPYQTHRSPPHQPTPPHPPTSPLLPPAILLPPLRSHTTNTSTPSLFPLGPSLVFPPIAITCLRSSIDAASSCLFLCRYLFCGIGGCRWGLGVVLV